MNFHYWRRVADPGLCLTAPVTQVACRQAARSRCSQPADGQR